MSSTDLSAFLQALNVVKKDYTCAVCTEMCKDPVTLSKCYHIVCSEHYQNLKYCPVCKISVCDGSTYSDDRLSSCIESTKKLCDMFSKYEQTKESTIAKPGKKRGRPSASEKIDNAKATKDIQPKPDAKNVNKQISKQKTNTFVEMDDSKENKNKNANTGTKSRNENVNNSILSTNSSKFSKATEKRNNKGETMLHIACRVGKIDRVTELLAQGANTNTKDNAGWTPLHEVVQNGRLDIVKLLLQYNTLIDVPGQDNETPLHEAVRFSQDEIAVELVRNGADIHARNSKGETPLDIASKDMKKLLLDAADNILQTQTVNVTFMSELQAELDFEDIRVYCATQSKTILSQLKNLIKNHSNLHLEQKWSKKVTHLIVDADSNGFCQLSFDVLQGVVSSLWILTTAWVTDSTDDKLQPFSNYEVEGILNNNCKGPKNSRYNKYKQYPGLFDGCHFYLHNFNTKFEINPSLVLTKPILSKLITDAGGVVLRRVPNPESIPESEQLVPYHAKKDGKLTKCSHYIIFRDMYQPMYNMQHLKAMPVGWLVECLEKYLLCEPW